MDANESIYSADRSRLEGRAIVPPIRSRISRDILPASFMHARSSPSPFALAVYTINESKNAAEACFPLEMFFVSDRASDDRSPYAHMCNPTGVLPGWYVVSEPGQYYEVRHRRMNTHMPNLRGSYNVILTRLYIDGIPASRTTLYDVERCGPAIYDQVDVGFDVDTGCSDGGVAQKVLKRFRFTRANVTDLNSVEGESGTIHLRVKVGERVPLTSGGNWDDNRRWGDCEKARPVSEDAIEKEGRSIQTAATHTVTQNWLRSDFSATNVHPWSEADIVVHVREAAWMQSRRLIDDHGNACTHARLKMWLEEDLLRQVGSAKELLAVGQKGTKKYSQRAEEISEGRKKPGQRGRIN